MTKHKHVREREAALAAYQVGLTLDEVASEYGISHETIRLWLISANIPRRPAYRPSRVNVTAEAKVAAIDAYQEGHTLHQVAAQTGVDFMTVRKWLVAANVPRRPRGRPKICNQKLDAAIAAYQAGDDVRIIAAHLGVAKNTVYNWLRGAGIPRRPAGRPKSR